MTFLLVVDCPVHEFDEDTCQHDRLAQKDKIKSDLQIVGFRGDYYNLTDSRPDLIPFYQGHRSC